MGRVVKRAFKFRFYPTDAQAAELARTFGCVRKVYNLALAVRTEAWTLRQERVNYNATSAMLTTWKRTDELAFLNEVSSVPLQQALRHLQVAFTNFFAKRARYPTFKSRKKSRRSAEYTTSAFRWRDGHLTLAKMAEPLAIVWSRPLPEGAFPSTVTVSQDLSRKAKGSQNRANARVRVALVHAKIAGRRRDHLHELTTRLVRENQAIVIEDLTVRNMVKNHELARAISDAAWRQFRTMLECKAEWHGRDVNAARNILAEGLSVAACGGGVRPQRTRARKRQSPVKQEPQRATAGIPRL